MKRKNKSQTALNFGDKLLDDYRWPEHTVYPLNLKGRSKRVESEVMKDLGDTTESIILTGFTSLSHLIDVFGNGDFPKLDKVKIVLGFEPTPKGRKQYETEIKLSREIREYWLKCGLSITLGGAVIRLIHLIETGKVEFRFLDRLHAKIYVSDHFAILGSSNFSKSGLVHQHEANVRVAKTEENATIQYGEIKTIAENYYAMATAYNDEMIQLLRDLIQQVTWQEALARAIAEVIEGNWLQEYRELYEKLNQAKLWPTQWRGIAQAMNIVQNQSNVLIADPTGSGKTKMCSSLTLALIHWLWENGKINRSNSLIVCPPMVIPAWQHEYRSLSRINHNQVSMGMLSNGGERAVQNARDEIALANVITIDEAHNYIRPDSKRSKAIHGHKADHVILSTATPINKRAEDLLRLIQLLDVDNLSDEDFKTYKRLRERPGRAIERSDLNDLKGFISQFIVRRTKNQLNEQIKKEREKYLNRNGTPCRFPEQNCRLYETKEDESDLQIAREISDCIHKLKGLTHLRRFSKPDYELEGFEAQKEFIDRCIRAGQALAGFLIRESLRSSHAALIEHLVGGVQAKDILEFKTKKSKTGHTITKVEGFKGQKPNLGSFHTQLFPSWITDDAEFDQAVEQELVQYRRILDLAKKLSGKRERGKVDHLAEQYNQHGLVLAFDSIVITLDYMKTMFERHYPEVEVHTVTGAEKDAKRDEILEMCSLGSTAKAIILCSDALNEGVNLQQASSITLLDMPSVLRIAEQRIGRIHRMDSEHDTIEAWWPDDSEEFGLKGDKRLIDTLIVAETIYGGNLEVPRKLKDRRFKTLESANAMVQEYKHHMENDLEWEGINDNFKPIVELKEGKAPIISEAVYDKIKDIHTSIRTRVSFIESTQSWVFFALRATKSQSPKWYFVNEKGKFFTQYPTICEQLRLHLNNDLKRLDWNQIELDKFLDRMQQSEIDLLPHKRRRALAVAKILLEQKFKTEDEGLLKDKIQETLLLFEPGTRDVVVDYYQFAEQWINVLQPLLDKKREMSRRKKKVFNLNNLIKDSKAIVFTPEQLQTIIDSCSYTERIDGKIVSCIVGVGVEI